MPTTSEEMTITYGGVSIGGFTARRIDGWTRDEQDYTNAWFEFEFVTTAASDAALVAELDTLRAEFRKPRLDLVVTQNGATYLSRKHSTNTALNTFPRIVKDGDPADTGRSHHFRVRIEYELPADNVSTNFRRGSTINVQYTPSRRRTVTISGIYTAATSGSTTALAQYSAQIAAYETSALEVVDSNVTWEQIGEPQVEFFETNKLLSFTRVYREVNFNQTTGALDDPDIIDPQMIITRNRISPWNSVSGGLSRGGGGGGGGGGAGIAWGFSGGFGSTFGFASGGGSIQVGQGSAQGGAGVSGGVKPPIFVHIEYATNINISNVALQAKWSGVIEPWLLSRAGSDQGANVILVDENVRFDDYENRIMATLDLIAYGGGIISQKITHRDTTAYGRVLLPTTEPDPFAFYDYQGPIVRQRVVTEQREEVTSNSDVGKYVDGLVWDPGSKSSFGDEWAVMTREPFAAVLHRGLSGTKSIAEVTIETVLQFRHKKAPAMVNTGRVRAGTISPG